MNRHIPVLLKETLEALDPRPGNFIIDGTVNGGGHAAEILKRIMPSGKLLGIDLDQVMIENSRKKISEVRNPELEIKNLILMQGNYKDLPEILRKKNLGKADALLLDLGFSSNQLEEPDRGFSFLRDEILDMRYDREVKSLTAAEAVNSFSEKDLADIIFKYGEERFSRQIAKKIVEERRKKRIYTTFELVEIIKKAVPKSYEKGRIHPATRVFQALRIFVNDELGNLETVLANLEKIIKPKGRAVIITFHSLEDKEVKNRFRDLAKKKKVEILTKKPVMASRQETIDNPRSRSAKLRVCSII